LINTLLNKNLSIDFEDLYKKKPSEILDYFVKTFNLQSLLFINENENKNIYNKSDIIEQIKKYIIDETINTNCNNQTTDTQPDNINCNKIIYTGIIIKIILSYFDINKKEINRNDMNEMDKNIDDTQQYKEIIFKTIKTDTTTKKNTVYSIISYLLKKIQPPNTGGGSYLESLKTEIRMKISSIKPKLYF
jgi:hypothetical protein